jgi:hypothetical protein
MKKVSLILSIVGLAFIVGCGSGEQKMVDAMCACEENKDDFDAYKECMDKVEEDFDAAAIAEFDADKLASALVNSSCNSNDEGEAQMTEDDAKEAAKFIIEAAKAEAGEGEEEETEE